MKYESNPKPTYLNEPPKINVPSDTIFSTAGYLYLLPSLIGRDLINDRFKAVGLEGNVDSLIKIGKKKGLSLEIMLESISYESKELITSKNRINDINYITNKDSLLIFRNIKSELKLSDKDFYSLGEQAIKQDYKSKMFLYGVNHDIRKAANNVVILSNLKNKTKNFEVSIKKLEVVTNSQYSHQISLTSKPIIGIEHPNFLAYWNAGMQHGVASRCKGMGKSECEIKINDFTKEFTIKYKFKQEQTKTNTPGFLSNYFKKKYDEKLMKLKEDGKTVEIEKEKLVLEINSKKNMVISIMKQMRHPDTFRHQLRTFFFAAIAAKQMGMSNEQFSIISKSQAIHDNQKNATPESILHLIDKPTKDQITIIKAHSALSELAMLSSGFSPEVAIIGSEHQHKADGSGYPATIPIYNKDNEIIDYRSPTWKETTVLGNLSQLVDATDAIEAERAYKIRVPIKKVQKILTNDIKSGILPPHISNFYIENTLETLIKLDYNSDKFFAREYDVSKDGTETEKQIIQYILGYNQDFKVKQVPENVKNFIENHKIDLLGEEERSKHLSNSIAKLYSELGTKEAKELFKRPLDENLRKYLPNDGIKAL